MIITANKRNKRYNSALAVFGLGILTAYLHPWHVHPYRSYYHEALAVFGVLIAFGFLAVDRAPRLNFPRILWLPLALFLLVVAQAASGLSHWSAVLLPLLYFLLLALAMMLGATWAATPGGSEKICLMLAVVHLAAGLLSVAMQGVQLSGVEAWPLVMYIATNAQAFMRPYANVAQPNQLALLLCMALAGLWYLHQRQRLGARAAFGLALALLWGVALTQSRIGWIILPAFAFWCAAPLPGGKPVSRLALGSLLLAYLVLVLSLPMLAQALGYSGGSVAEHVGGRSERMVLWQQAWRMATVYPWLGVGWGGYGAKQVGIAGDFGAGTYAEHAHNLILNLAAELGWPAALTIAAGLGWWARQTCVRPPATPLLRFAGLNLLAVLVHSLVEFPLWYAYVLLPSGLLLGMLHQLRWPAAGVRAPRFAILGSVMLSCLLLVTVTLDYQRVVAGFRALRGEQEGYAVRQDVLRMPARTLFPQFFEYFRLMKVAPREGMAPDEIAFVERWSPRFGFVHILNKLAEVSVLNGRPQQAGRAMLTLQRLHPAAYPEYYDYWQARSVLDVRYRFVFERMPRRDAP